MNKLDKLKDIKDIVEVTDYSLYQLIAIVITFLLILIVTTYLYKNRITKTKQPSKKQLALKRLKELDFTNTKDVVYSFSLDGYIFVNESNQEKFNQIEKELEQYKYKKDIQPLEQNIITQIKEFIKGIKNVK